MNEHTLPQLFKQSLKKVHLLVKTSETYSLTEGGVLYIFKPPEINATGLRIEICKLKLFGGTKGIAKMCDALFVVHYKEQDFIIAVEIKSARTSAYKKQLSNGRRFCEWQIKLLKDHEHYSGNPKYLDLLVQQQNPNHPPKNTTQRNDFELLFSDHVPVYRSDKVEIHLGMMINKYLTTHSKPT